MRTADVKDRSLTAVDFKPGQLPRGARGAAGPIGPSYAATSSGLVIDPSPTSEVAVATFAFELPTAGSTLVEMFTSGSAATCTAGAPRAGLYVDGEPLPRTGVFPTLTFDEARAALPRGIVELAAGPHTATFGLDCPGGEWATSRTDDTSWKVQLIGGS